MTTSEQPLVALTVLSPGENPGTASVEDPCCGGPSQAVAFLNTRGVNGRAGAALAELVKGALECTPTVRCIARKRNALEVAARWLGKTCVGDADFPVEPLMLLLAFLETLVHESLELIAAHFDYGCQGDCGRQGPDGKKSRRASVNVGREIAAAPDESIRQLQLEPVMGAEPNATMLVLGFPGEQQISIRLGKLASDLNLLKAFLELALTGLARHGESSALLNDLRQQLELPLPTSANRRKWAKDGLRGAVNFAGTLETWKAFFNVLSEMQKRARIEQYGV